MKCECGKQCIFIATDWVCKGCYKKRFRKFKKVLKVLKNFFTDKCNWFKIYGDKYDW